MGKFTIEEISYTPEKVFAGDYPVLTETAPVGGTALKRLSPVKLKDGKLEPVAAVEDAPDLYGIAAEDADATAPGVVYLTGEFFASGLVWPEGVTASDLKLAFRKLAIFLK